MKSQNINIKCLVKASKKFGFNITYFDKYGNLVLLKKDDIKLFFSNFSTPFNNQSIASIVKDKSFTHLILRDKIKMPKFGFYFDPKHPKSKFNTYKDFFSFQEIVDDIEKELFFPVIVKKNKGEQGKNIFLCKNKKEAENALNKIFDYNSKFYDYIVLVEEYFEIKKEYRVVCFEGKIFLCYLKDNFQAEFVGNLSPLHFKNAKAVLVDNKELIFRIQKFIKPIFNHIPIKFTGLDIAETKKGELCLLEINSQPMFKIAEKSFGAEPIVRMYEEILKSF